ncbi:secreted protein [Candidatus Magnetomorum sp. HK-1]|nr:secreted protein [Candidatus Magnetomorum sp. HK-1]
MKKNVLSVVLLVGVICFLVNVSTVISGDNIDSKQKIDSVEDAANQDSLEEFEESQTPVVEYEYAQESDDANENLKEQVSDSEEIDQKEEFEESQVPYVEYEYAHESEQEKDKLSKPDVEDSNDQKNWEAEFNEPDPEK